MPRIDIDRTSGIPSVKINELKGWQPSGLAMELMAKDIDEILAREFPDIVTQEVRRSTAYVSIISGLEELIKNVFDAALEIKDPNFTPEMTIEITSDGGIVQVDCKDNCTGFPDSKIGKYKNTRDPEVTPATPSTKNTPNSLAPDFATAGRSIDSASSEIGKRQSPEPEAIGATESYHGGRGIGINRIAKVVQGNESGELYRLNIQHSDGRTGALARAKSNLTPAKFNFSDVGKFETDSDTTFFPQQLNDLVPTLPDYTPPGPDDPLKKVTEAPALPPNPIHTTHGSTITPQLNLREFMKLKREAKKSGIPLTSEQQPYLPKTLATNSQGQDKQTDIQPATDFAKRLAEKRAAKKAGGTGGLSLDSASKTDTKTPDSDDTKTTPNSNKPSR